MVEASTNLIAWANFCTAIGTFIGIAKLWLKLESDNERQNRQITRMLNELRINTEYNKAPRWKLISPMARTEPVTTPCAA